MSTKKPNEHQDPEVIIENAIGKTEFFIEKQGKKLLIALIAVVAIVGGYFAYANLYATPRAEKASAAMFQAQYEFERDSFAVALSGNTLFEGFESIISEYSGTEQANLAAHYAGLCCLRTGEFERAIKFFEQFKAVEGAAGEVISAQNTGLIGDCYIEMGNTDKGIEYYIKAVKASDNATSAPVFIQKAALANLAAGKAAEALAQFQTIKSQYPGNQFSDIDKYIALAEQQVQ